MILGKIVNTEQKKAITGVEKQFIGILILVIQSIKIRPYATRASHHGADYDAHHGTK